MISKHGNTQDSSQISYEQKTVKYTITNKELNKTNVTHYHTINDWRHHVNSLVIKRVKPEIHSVIETLGIIVITKTKIKAIKKI